MALKSKPNAPRIKLECIALDKIFWRDATKPSGYQRDTAPARVEKIIGEFDENKFDPPLVRKVDDRFALIDGKGRIAALRELGYTEVYARLADIESIPGEADIYLASDAGKARFTAVEKHLGKRAAGHVDALDIDGALKRFGLEVGPQGFRSIASLYSIYEKGGTRGAELVDETIDIIMTGWDATGFDKLFEPNVIKGVAAFVIAYPGYDREHLFDVLRNNGPAAILQRVDGMEDNDTKPTRFAKTMMRAYNKDLNGKGLLRKRDKRLEARERRAQARATQVA